jgi:serine/threonine protein kinase
MNKKVHELDIFYKFIQSKYFDYKSISTPSIYEDDKNGPDIECKYDDKDKIGFQLVRLMSKKHYKQFGELKRLITKVENKLRNKDILNSKHITISVKHICFKKKSINTLFNSIFESITKQKVKRQIYNNYTLTKHLKYYEGDVLKSLKAFRPLVEVVSKMHKNNIVHRDIKPDNIFISDEDRLILGDCGLVFFLDSAHTRATDTLESVGSKHWMPEWATGVRLDDIKPSFDIFTLGKVLWSMISGKIFLRLWYYTDPDFNLENLFPNKSEMRFINIIFKHCIVERENNCLNDAGKLLEIIDETIYSVERHCDVIGMGIERKCKVCGKGRYGCIANENLSAVRNFGINPTGSQNFKIFACEHCGHIQMFHVKDGPRKPKAWLKN